MLGPAVWQSKCNTFCKEDGELARLAASSTGKKGTQMEYRQLTQDERYVMARLLRQGHSHRSIALILDRAASTISRERRRNATRYDGAYRAEKAQEYAMGRRRRTRKGSQFSQQEWAEVAALLERKWSPGQIVGRRRLLRQPSMSKEVSNSSSSFAMRFVRKNKAPNNPQHE